MRALRTSAHGQHPTPPVQRVAQAEHLLQLPPPQGVPPQAEQLGEGGEHGGGAAGGGAGLGGGGAGHLSAAPGQGQEGGG